VTGSARPGRAPAFGSSGFTRGISTHIGLQTVDLFLQRRFQAEHLLSRFIARIETAAGDVFWNAPRENPAAPSRTCGGC